MSGKLLNQATFNVAFMILVVSLKPKLRNQGIYG